MTQPLCNCAHSQQIIVWVRGRSEPEKQRHDRCIHPSGPHPIYDTVIRGPKGEPIALALIAGYTKQEGTANAALLAAAPDLLDALRLIATAQERGFGIDYAKGCALAAIARATGEQP